MNKAEMEHAKSLMDPDPKIEWSDLMDLTERTLLVGTVSAGFGVHIYLKDGQIHRLLHRDDRMLDLTSSCTWSVHALLNLLASVRPEYTDANFSYEVAARGGRIHFNSFSDDAYKEARARDFHAPVAEELQ